MSAEPTPYSPTYNFTDFQESNPATPLPADELDAQLNAISTSVNETQDRLAEIQNDDGSLANASVGNAQLKSEVTIGVSAATDWLTATLYEANDTVYQSNNVYRCLVAHTSGVFAAELAAGKWAEILDFNQYLSVANAAAVAASASEVAAELAETNAEAAETNAEAALTDFKNRYLGAFAVAPSTRLDGSPLEGGETYFNSFDGNLYAYYFATSLWRKTSAQIAATRSVSYANGDGGTVTFAVTYDVGNIDIYVAGVKQRVDTANSSPAANYDVSAANGTSVTFAAAPSSGTRNIQFNVLGAFQVSSIAAGSIDTSQLADGAVETTKAEMGGPWFSGVDTGTATAHAVEIETDLTDYDDGMLVLYRPANNSNGSAITIQITGSGGAFSTAVPLETIRRTPPVAGELKGDDEVFARYNAAEGKFTILSQSHSQLIQKGVIEGSSTANALVIEMDTDEVAWATLSEAENRLLMVTTTDVNTGAMTLDYMGLGAKAIRKPDNSALIAGQIASGMKLLLTYDSTFASSSGAWIILNPLVEPSSRIAIIEHQESAGVNGGTTTSGSWETAPYNTEVSDVYGIVSLSSNAFTLQAGTYLVRWSRVYGNTALSQTRLYNVTDASVTSYGKSIYSGYGIEGTGEAVVTITTAKSFRIESRVQSNVSNTGFGKSANWSSTEVYGNITIQKLA